MAQHDFVVENGTFPAVRADINSVLQAILTNNSGATAPATTAAYMRWYDTSTNILKERNAANNAWINIGSYDQTSGLFIPASNSLTSAKTTAYTVVMADRNSTILCDATSAAFSITLPAAATAGNGFIITVKKTDSSANAVTIDGNGSETIDGALTQVLSGQYDNITLISNGTAWFMLGKTYGVFTSSVDGLVPKPVTAANKYLKDTGIWAAVSPADILKYYASFGSDFIEPFARSPFSAITLGAGASSSLDVSDTGYLAASTGTTTTGVGGVCTANPSLINFAAQNGLVSRILTACNVLTLPNGTDNFTFFSGMISGSTSSTTPTNTASFGVYLTNGNTNWQLRKRVSGVDTLVDSGVAAASGLTFFEIRVTNNTSVGSVVVALYINGVFACQTTGIQATTYDFWPTQVVKTAGTTARVVYCDFGYFVQQLVSIRGLA